MPNLSYKVDPSTISFLYVANPERNRYRRVLWWGSMALEWNGETPELVTSDVVKNVCETGVLPALILFDVDTQGVIAIEAVNETKPNYKRVN